MKLRMIGIAALALASFGFTECEYYTDVTVPASDPHAPGVYDAIWNRDTDPQYEVVAPGGGIEYTLRDRNAVVLAIPSGLDSGGLKRIKVFSSTFEQCCSNGICSQSQPSSVPTEEIQPGTIGSTVSNGIWLSTAVGPLGT